MALLVYLLHSSTGDKEKIRGTKIRVVSPGRHTSPFFFDIVWTHKPLFLSGTESRCPLISTNCWRVSLYLGVLPPYSEISNPLRHSYMARPTNGSVSLVSIMASQSTGVDDGIQATARVLDLEISCMYLPDVMLISFDDSGTGTSSIKFIRQTSALDLGKLDDSYELYWKVHKFFLYCLVSF